MEQTKRKKVVLCLLIVSPSIFFALGTVLRYLLWMNRYRPANFWWSIFTVEELIIVNFIILLPLVVSAILFLCVSIRPTKSMIVFFCIWLVLSSILSILFSIAGGGDVVVFDILSIFIYLSRLVHIAVVIIFVKDMITMLKKLKVEKDKTYEQKSN